MKKKKMYHVTSIENLKSIMANGIRSNTDGEIFLFDELDIWNPYVGDIFVSDHIAKNQVFLEKYVMIEINPKGIVDEVVNDNVGEFTAPVQWILSQIVIHQKFLKVIGYRKGSFGLNGFYYEWYEPKEISNGN